MDREQKQDWYFTFGFGQPHENCFIVFTGTYMEARQKMIDAFGKQWAFQYSVEEWNKHGKSQEELYNLKRIY